MIRLNENLLLLPRNEIIQGSFGLSFDVLYQHTFSSWIQFLELGKVKTVNLGVLAQWEDEEIVKRIETEDNIRRLVNGQIEAFANLENNYYHITKEIGDRIFQVLTAQGRFDQTEFFIDYLRKETIYHETVRLLRVNYYGDFAKNMFGVPVHFVRQKGQDYYFVQQYGENLIVPNIVSLEQSGKIIDSWIQKKKLARTSLWQEFRVYIRKTFGVRIQYGKPEVSSYDKKRYASKWRGRSKK